MTGLGDNVCKVPMPKSTMSIVHKTHADKSADGMTFVLSDESVDRMGDVIMADGWELSDFRKNPIALFGHRSDFMVGTWKNLRVEKQALLGDLEPAPKGTSERADEIIRFVSAGVLKAVSVGFLPIERKTRMDGERFLGYTFLKQSLVETSIVAVPANPNALQVAKDLNLSPDVRKLVFAEVGKKEDKTAQHDHIGELAKLIEPDTWSPELAHRAKQWLAGLAKTYPDNPLYRKLYRLMDEIETVSTIVAEHGSRTKRAS